MYEVFAINMRAASRNWGKMQKVLLPDTVELDAFLEVNFMLETGIFAVFPQFIAYSLSSPRFLGNKKGPHLDGRHNQLGTYKNEPCNYKNLD